MLDRSADRQRNTFEYSRVSIFVEADPESISGISFSIPDKDLNLLNTFCSFAYFDDLKQFIDCGQDWELFT